MTHGELSIIGFAPKGPPKWGFGAILGVGAKIFGGKVHPDPTRCVVEFCVGIAICCKQNFGQVWGSAASLPEVAGNLWCRTPLDICLSHGKIGIIPQCNPWAAGWSLEGTF